MATKYPPQLSLSEAIRVIKEIYSKHKTTEISFDLLPEIFKVSKGSSYFPAKIVTLQRFGLADRKPNDVLGLTKLAMQIIDPIGDEDIEAREVVFRKDEVLASLLEKYPNGNLPSSAQLELTLHKSYGIPKDTLGRWYQFVINSFRELNTKRSITVSDSGTGTDDKPRDLPQDVTPKKGFQNFELPSGKKFSFSLEDGHTLDDLEFITDFFELKKKRIDK